jgi:ribonuclease J
MVDEPYGIDFALPDLSVLEDTRSELAGYVITHAHEDHIGALPYAIRARPAPIFATSFSARMIERRFSRSGESAPIVHEVAMSAPKEIGPFRIQWIPVSHSIPDAAAVAVGTRFGWLLHSGDFRVDLDPVLGAPTDIDGLTALGDEGVYCLLADSTGADAPGKNPGEKSVHGPLRQAIADAPGRVVVATFSSHVPRLKILEQIAAETKRKLCVLGRGMRSVVEIAKRQGLLSPAVLCEDGQIVGVPKERQLIVGTGSQGEIGSALWLLAHRKHAYIELEAEDRVIFSSRVIPGAELQILEVVDRLRTQNVEVRTGREGRHVSGHGTQEDLEMLLAATRPRFFVALHGDPRQLHAHRNLARKMGVAAERVLPVESGDSLRFLENGGARIDAGVHREPIASGPRVVHDPKSLLDARKRMATGGVLWVHQHHAEILFRPHALDPAISSQDLEKIRQFAAQLEGPVEERISRVAGQFIRLRVRVPEIVWPQDAPASLQAEDENQ